MLKKILFTVLVLLVGIQFFRIDKINPTLIAGNDFLEMNNPPEEVAAVLITSCYDCHSNKTNYPWYSNVSPVSWWIAGHVKEGREELNFSEWGKYPEKRKAKKLKEIIEEVENEMPLPSYLIMHSSAMLSSKQKEDLINWVKYLQL